MVNVQKRLKGASFGAEFLYDENLYYTEKKAQNSYFEWGPLHGEIGLLKKQILFFAIFPNFYYSDLSKIQ